MLHVWKFNQQRFYHDSCLCSKSGMHIRGCARNAMNRMLSMLQKSRSHWSAPRGVRSASPCVAEWRRRRRRRAWPRPHPVSGHSSKLCTHYTPSMHFFYRQWQNDTLKTFSSEFISAWRPRTNSIEWLEKIQPTSIMKKYSISWMCGQYLRNKHTWLRIRLS